MEGIVTLVCARLKICADSRIADHMSSIQATRMKRGMLIKMGSDLFRVLDLTHFTPGNKRGFVQARMRNIRTGQQADNKFRAEEDVERAILDERQMQYLYRDGDAFHFMDTSTYEQIHLDAEVLGDNANYILPEMVIAMEFYGDEPVGIELPITVDLKVIDTTPGINRATASAQVKPATVETGLVVSVPAHVSIGDVIRVGTEDGEYQKKL